MTTTAPADGRRRGFPAWPLLAVAISLGLLASCRAPPSSADSVSLPLSGMTWGTYLGDDEHISYRLEVSGSAQLIEFVSDREEDVLGRSDAVLSGWECDDLDPERSIEPVERAVADAIEDLHQAETGRPTHAWAALEIAGCGSVGDDDAAAP